MDAPPTLDAGRLVRLRRLTSVVAAPSGTWLAVAASRLDEEGARFVSDIWRVDPGTSQQLALTRTDSNDRAPIFRGDGALFFLSDRRQGKEDEARDQVWMLPAQGGEPRPVTDEPLGVLSFRLAPGGRLLVMAPVLPGVPHDAQRGKDEELKKKGPSALHYRTSPVRFFDAWLSPAAPHLVSWEEGVRRDLTPDADREFREAAWDLSMDGRVAVVTSSTLAEEDRLPRTDLLLFDLEVGTSRTLQAGPRTVLGTPRLSKEGDKVACTRHRRTASGIHGKEALWLVDTATGEGRELAPSWDCWGVPAFFTSDGRQVVATADDEGQVPVFAVNVESGEVSRLTVEGGTHEAVAPLGDRDLIGLRSRFLHPPEPFLCELKAGSTPRIVSRLSGFTEEEGAALATVARAESRESDGTPVPYFLVRPRGQKAPGPTVLWIHGGPRSQFADGWHWRWNALTFAAAGFTVALANPRGSTGRGQAIIEGLFPNRWGDTTYRDVMAVADSLVAGGADPERLAAMGGSFGGYMVNWIGGNTDRFRCLVTHASIYDMTAFHGVTDWPTWWAYEMGATPWADPEAFDRYSPHRQVASWRSPTLVIHGEKDYRVPIGEALALFEALQHHGVPSELLVFPDENHFVLKPRNIVVWYEEVQAFLRRYLTATRTEAPPRR